MTGPVGVWIACTMALVAGVGWAMRAADWRVAGDVTDLPVLGVFVDKAGTGGGELRNIHTYINDVNKESN